MKLFQDTEGRSIINGGSLELIGANYIVKYFANVRWVNFGNG